MFRRKVVLFGRSVPLALLLAATLATLALAAFLGRLLISGSVSGTAGAVVGSSWNLESVACTPLGDGTATCTQVDNGAFTVALGGQSNTSSLEIRIAARNVATDGSGGCWTARPAWSFGSSSDVASPVPGSAQPGQIISANQDAFFNVLLGFQNVTAGQSLATTLQYDFETAGDLVGSC